MSDALDLPSPSLEDVMIAEVRDPDPLVFARGLLAAGIPVFVMPPNPSFDPERKGSHEFVWPTGWQRTVADPSALDSWELGWAVCMVAGHGLDAVDVDPRNGSDVEKERERLRSFGVTILGETRTPGGGAHFYVASTGLPTTSSTNLGIDFRGGTRTGEGAGCLFLPGTIRPKYTGAGYTLEVIPDPTRAGRIDCEAERQALSRYLARGVAPAEVDEVVLPPEPESVAEDDIPPWLSSLLSDIGPQWTLADGTTSSDRSARFHHLVAATHRAGLADGQILTLMARWCREVGLYDGIVPSEVARSLSKITGETDTEAKHRNAVEKAVADLRARRDARALLAAEDAARAGDLWQVPLAHFGAAFVARPTPIQYFRVAQLWPTQGNVVLVARAKVGKTTLVLNLARSLVTGEDFLGRFEVQPVSGRVCIIDLELSEATLQRWCADVGLGHDGILIMPQRGRGAWLAETMTNPALRARLADWLRERAVEVLIIDPLAALLAGAGVEENSNGEVSRLLRGAVAALQAEAGISELLLVHHAGYGADRARGASSLIDWPDATWTYSTQGRSKGTRADDEDDEVEEEALRMFSAKGRDVALPKTRVTFDAASRRLTIDSDNTIRLAEDGAARRAAMDAHLLHVLVHSFGGSVGSKNDWESAAGKKASEARAAIARLTARGVVREVAGKTASAMGYELVDTLRGDDG